MTEISTIIRARLSNGRSISDEDVLRLLAERDALQARVAELEKALRNIEADCCSDCPPSHRAIKYACRDALEGKKDE